MLLEEEEASRVVELLKERVQFYECMLNSLPAHVFITQIEDGGDVIPSVSNVWSNEWTLNAVGYSQKEINRMGSGFLKTVCHPDDVELVQKYLDFVKDNPGAVYSSISRVRPKDGEVYYWLYVRTLCLDFYPNGYPRQCLNVGFELDHDLPSGFSLATLLGGMNKIANEVRLKSLTNREREILKLIVLGFSDKSICEKLFISIATAKTHRNRILRKLQVKNPASLVALGKECGL